MGVGDVTPGISGLLVCPACHQELASSPDSVQCPDGHTYPCIDGYVDFVAHERSTDWTSVMGPPDQHEQEAAGIDHRVRHYYLPYLRRTFGNGRLRVLDDGAGFGRTVELLAAEGVDAYGVDPGSRRDQWTRFDLQDRLVAANGRSLPFPDETFDAVVSSGVLEHVGEHLPMGQRGGPCAEYVHEALRVLRPGGRALLAAPNGLHPLDYWHTHGTYPRIHSPFEDWMPRPGPVREWVRDSPIPGRVRFLSPHDFLAFKRVRSHLYGRVFSGAMQAIMRLIDRVPALAASPLNPWLVVEITRTEIDTT